MGSLAPTMERAAERGVSGAIVMAVLSVLLAGASAYGATAFTIEGSQFLVYLTFLPPAGMALIGAGFEVAAAASSRDRGRRFLEIGLILLGTSLAWLAFCGVLAAGADLLSSNGGAEGVGHN
jgi:hypothetical protein